MFGAESAPTAGLRKRSERWTACGHRQDGVRTAMSTTRAAQSAGVARVGVTQADLAQILGMSRSAVSLRYTGRVAWRIDELERVAWYLNFPVTDLLEKPKKVRRLRSL
jgi:betR domain